MLGLCTAQLFDPARPIIWTRSSLSRVVDLFDLQGFYQSAMTPALFEGLLQELIDENPFAIRAALRILKVDYTTEIPTLPGRVTNDDHGFAQGMVSDGTQASTDSGAGRCPVGGGH